MCQKVYQTCEYCGAHRFANWEECALFWTRYKHIVVDLGRFQDRPYPHDCAKRSATLRWLKLGACPRLKTCYSLFDYSRKRPRRVLKGLASVAAVAALPTKQPPIIAEEETKKQERDREMERRDFAELWFRKRPVPALPPTSSSEEPEGCVADAGAARLIAADAGGLPKQSLSWNFKDMRLSDTQQNKVRLLFSEAEAGTSPRSLASTVIESDSEVDSEGEGEGEGEAVSKAALHHYQTRARDVPAPRR